MVYSEVIYRVEASAKKIKTFLCYFVFLSCNEDLCKDYVELHSGLIQYCNICSSKQWQQQNSYNGPVQITGIFICGFQELRLKTSLHFHIRFLLLQLDLELDLVMCDLLWYAA